MPTLTKICGITTPAALDAAVAGHASHLGFVFFAPSPRNLAPAQAAALAAHAPPRAALVGVFVDPDDSLLEAAIPAARLTAVQLHGCETPARAAEIRARFRVELWKALPVARSADLAAIARWRGAADRIILDAKPPAGADLPGGNGLRFDWRILEHARLPLRWGLSGGLDPDNVAEAIRITGTPFVDVSSGVEDAPGVKSPMKIAAFLAAVRAA